MQRLSHHETAAEALAAFGLGDVRGCEEAAAAIASAWEHLRFWEPMIELGRQGEFTGHLAELRRCEQQIEANPPPAHRADILERWEQARAAQRRALPAKAPPAVAREDLQQHFSQAGRGRTQVTVTAARD